MPVLREWRCLAHGPFESFDAMCPHGCPEAFVQQEIRTAPAARRPGTMRFIDNQLKGIANDYGVTDLRTDPKANLSALDMQRRRQEHKPHWVEIPHAAPGFSQTGEAAPVFKPESMGFTPSEGMKDLKLPKPRPNIVARHRE